MVQIRQRCNNATVNVANMVVVKQQTRCILRHVRWYVHQ